ncbi:TPM domain-containing protein [Flavobacterium album]|uniref:TPM domain-containing protein n=1 Tax=Flavobacterium album TaxID=2175091 RepID=UPI001FE4E0B2|nr:TPM domain-containing protein [Flavobacterium album]
MVITIKSLKGESIGELTPKWAHQWGIGQVDKDNGVLILMAKDDHEVWIAPGYGVDDRLTAGQLGQMIRTVMIPEFKVGKDYKALDKGTDAIFRMLEGKYMADKTEENERPWWGFFILEALIFFFCFIYHALGGFWAIATAVAMYSASGKSSGKPRSGFRGGFGGGGFSGGGAGGKW